VKDVSFATGCRWSIKWGLACSCIFESAFSNEESMCVRTDGSSSCMPSSSAAVVAVKDTMMAGEDFPSLCFSQSLLHCLQRRLRCLRTEHHEKHNPLMPLGTTLLVPYSQRLQRQFGPSQNRTARSGRPGQSAIEPGGCGRSGEKGECCPSITPLGSTRRHHSTSCPGQELLGEGLQVPMYM